VGQPCATSAHHAPTFSIINQPSASAFRCFGWTYLHADRLHLISVESSQPLYRGPCRLATDLPRPQTLRRASHVARSISNAMDKRPSARVV
jgi:hypothetical protein